MQKFPAHMYNLSKIGITPPIEFQSILHRRFSDKKAKHLNLPIGEQLLSFSTKVSRTNLTQKKRTVRDAGAEYSFNPVALPIAFLPKWGKKVADAKNKFKAIRNVLFR